MISAQLIGVLIANAPAAIQTLSQLKDLFMDGYNDVVKSVGEDATREQVLALMDEIAKKSAEIQAIK